jgi:hypothetical protein
MILHNSYIRYIASQSGGKNTQVLITNLGIIAAILTFSISMPATVHFVAPLSQAAVVVTIRLGNGHRRGK